MAKPLFSANPYVETAGVVGVFGFTFGVLVIVDVIEEFIDRHPSCGFVMVGFSLALGVWARFRFPDAEIRF
jgi:hypothetical protein